MLAVYCQSLPSHSATHPSEPHDRTAYQVQTPEHVGLLELDDGGDDDGDDDGLLLGDDDGDDDGLLLGDDDGDDDGLLLGGLLLDEQPTGVSSLIYQSS